MAIINITQTQFEKNITTNNKKFKTKSDAKSNITTEIEVNQKLFDVSDKAGKSWWNILKDSSEYECLDLLESVWNENYQAIFKPAYVDRKLINDKLYEVKSLMLAITAYLSFDRKDLDEFGRIACANYSTIFGDYTTHNNINKKWYFKTLEGGYVYIRNKVLARVL